MKYNKQESSMRLTPPALFGFLSIHVFALILPCIVSAQYKPNIIIFLADDLGYADIGVNGCQEIPTPHVDAVSEHGVRFMNGYST
jgi:hypothetical protein